MLGLVIVLYVQAAPLTFSEAIERVAVTPALAQRQQAVAEALDMAAATATLTSNPLVMLQPGARRIASDGSVAPEFYVSVAQDINLGGRGRKRRDAALAEARADGAHLQVLRSQARQDAAAAWLSVWTAQGSLAAAQDEQALAQDLSDRMGRAAVAGGLTRIDRSAAANYLAEARLAVLAYEGETYDAGIVLNRVLGLMDDTPAAVARELPRLAQAVGKEMLLSAAGESAVVRASAAFAQAQAVRLAEVESSNATGLQVGVLGWREGGGDLAAVATLQLTLPVFERSQRERSAQLLAIGNAESQLKRDRSDDRNHRLLLAHEVEHTAETLAMIENELIPAAQATADGLKRQFEVGETTVQEWVTARRVLVSALRRRVRAQADVVLARFRAKELLSSSVFPSSLGVEQ